MLKVFLYFNQRVLNCSLKKYLRQSIFSATNNRTQLFPKLYLKYTPTYPPLILCSHISKSISLNAELYTIFAPSFADSITEGDICWHCKIGEKVVEDQLLGEIETDKTALPIHAPQAGVVENLLVPDGEKISEGQELLQIRKAVNDFSQPIDNSFSTNLTNFKDTVEFNFEPFSKSTDSLSIVKSPTAMSQSTIPTLNPITPIEKASPTVNHIINTFAELDPEGSTINTRMVKRVKMSRMRIKISERLKASQNTAAMLTTFNEINMSNIISMRSKYKELFYEKHGVKLGIMSPFLKSAANALKEMPVINAVIDGSDIVYRNYIDISVAIATKSGLVVPVIKDVLNRSFLNLEYQIARLTKEASNNQISLEDLYGGTFTISNGGVFGSLYGTPIINPPQSAILGMHSIVERPVVISGQIVIRPMMYVALTYDHRLIDGREAVQFLKKIKSTVEDPLILLLDL